MPALNFKSMDVDALLALRSQIDGQLASRRSDLQKQLARLGGAWTYTTVRRIDKASGLRGRASALRGLKVEPKYRDAKTGDTWAGRGMKPRWLAAAMKGGKKLEDFLIDKSARRSVQKGRRKRR